MAELRSIELRKLKDDILQNGKIEGHELQALRDLLYANGSIGRPEAEFLVEVHRRVERVTPAFEHFFYQAIKDHVLTDGAVKATEAEWLRKMLFADEKSDDHRNKFLRELRGEARGSASEFQALCDEFLK